MPGVGVGVGLERGVGVGVGLGLISVGPFGVAVGVALGVGAESGVGDTVGVGVGEELCAKTLRDGIKKPATTTSSEQDAAVIALAHRNRTNKEMLGHVKRLATSICAVFRAM